MSRTLARRAGLLGRQGRVKEALADWDRALALATGARILEIRLGRAAALARSGDHGAALKSVADAERGIPNRAKFAIQSARVHAQVAEAISRDSALAASDRGTGVAAQCEAALKLIKLAARAPAYRDSRRLIRTLADHDFDPLRGYRPFELLLMDLAFPAQAFARPE